MSAIANIALLDGAATPLSHTFSPVNIDSSGVARWADRSSGIALGFPVISFSLKSPTKGSRNYKLTAKVVVPTLEVTSPSTSTGIQPQPTKAFDIIFNVEFVLPERSTLQQRKDALAFARNFLANSAVMTGAVESFENVY